MTVRARLMTFQIKETGGCFWSEEGGPKNTGEKRGKINGKRSRRRKKIENIIGEV